MAWAVVGYYTINSFYEEEAKRLIPSLQKFGIPYYIEPIESKGDWYSNTQYKPDFLKRMLTKFAPKSLIYVDIDAEFLQFPALFDQLDEKPDVHIGVHMLDHSKRGRSLVGLEMLSGTIFLRNSSLVHQLVDAWIQKCIQGKPHIWDQVALQQAIGSIPFFTLPEEYCTIFDYMSDVKNPVIKHYQASRRCRDLQDAPKEEHIVVPVSNSPPITKGLTQPRKIISGGFVRYHRKYRGFGV
jgi:hypothetical protein